MGIMEKVEDFQRLEAELSKIMNKYGLTKNGLPGGVWEMSQEDRSDICKIISSQIRLTDEIMECEKKGIVKIEGNVVSVNFKKVSEEK